MGHYLIPETLRIGPMDSGPAAMKSLLAGFGINLNYDALRQECQTDFDSANMDDMERLAQKFDFQTDQAFLPRDMIDFGKLNTQPMLVTLNSYDGSQRLAVFWKSWMGRIQVMDPATGRRWGTIERIRPEIMVEAQEMAADQWRTWAASPAFQEPLQRTMKRLGLSDDQARAFREEALADPSWWRLAGLDASVRLVRRMVHSGSLKAGAAAHRALTEFFNSIREGKPDVPEAFWSAGSPTTARDTQQLTVKGARVVRVLGRAKTQNSEGQTKSLTNAQSAVPELVRLLKKDGLLVPATIVGALVIESFLRLVEALMFRGALDIAQRLSLSQRATGLIALLILICLSALIIYVNTRGLLRLGHNFEARLRLMFLDKVPKLGDLYLQTHAISDLADRCHNVHYIRNSIYFGGEIIRGILRLLVTCIAVALLDVRLLPLVLISAFVCIYLPKRMSAAFSERDMRVRTLDGSMSRFYLDALVGLIPSKIHGSTRALRREQESLLVAWTYARRSFEFAAVITNGIIEFAGFLLSAAILLQYMLLHGADGGALLLLYWVLDIPFTGSRLSHASQRYAAYRSRGIRILEPLMIPDEVDVRKSTVVEPTQTTGPVSVRIEDAEVKLTGHVILQDIHLDIAPGTHMALVGPSGAGKSTLSGLMLGWCRPSKGQVLVNGAPLQDEHLERLREHTAWLDPSVQLWNKTFLENLCYGAPEGENPIGEVITAADLQHVLERLPDGLQTPLGADGGNFSGGEGQRIRMGRALLRRDARLVIMDEPFRGLDRKKREHLMKVARKWWTNATLICVTHDVSETLDFDRVAVVEAGRIVEDGQPRILSQQPNGRFARLLASEKDMLENQWGDMSWRKLELHKGRLVENAEEVAP